MESFLEQSDKIRQKGRRWRKIRNWTFLILFSGSLIAGAIRYYYPYEEGIKSGKLEYVVYKGLVFKTYEGKFFPSGIQSEEGEGIASIPEDPYFSVAKKKLAESLMRAGGKSVELHYKKYFGALPWRGSSRYVVNEIVNITEEPVLDIKELITNYELRIRFNYELRITNYD